MNLVFLVGGSDVFFWVCIFLSFLLACGWTLVCWLLGLIGIVVFLFSIVLLRSGADKDLLDRVTGDGIWLIFLELVVYKLVCSIDGGFLVLDRGMFACRIIFSEFSVRASGVSQILEVLLVGIGLGLEISSVGS